jgi:hypothetical protein
MSLKIRNLVLGEELPERLRTGYETGQCDDRWIWVAERDGKPVAILVTAPAHIVVILVRIVATEDALSTDVGALILKARREVRKRGYKGYVVWVDPTRETESSMIGIIRKTGGFQMPDVQVACGGAL